MNHSNNPLLDCCHPGTVAGSTSEAVENACVKYLAENMSYVLETADSKTELAAVLILGTERRKDQEGKPLEPLPPSANPKECDHRIRRILDKVDAEADLFALSSDVDEMIDIRLISIHPKYRGRKLAGMMMDKVRSLAEENGIKVVHAVCSSHFTALALAKLGYQCVYRLQYSEFVDSAGNAIFVPSPPHTAITVYALRLGNDPTSVRKLLR